MAEETSVVNNLNINMKKDAHNTNSENDNNINEDVEDIEDTVIDRAGK